jgi:hypothetical protein
MDNKGIQNIKKMYDKLNYFDQYGASVILFIIISIILFVSISYCYAKIHSQPIIDDWANQRCKPNIIPFAGFITHPDGVSAVDYTSQNFNYCVQSILSSITGMAVEPITFIANMFKQMADKVKEDIDMVRGMFDKVRSMFQEVSQEIMGRIMNFTIPLQQMVIGFKDLLSKVQGAMTAGLFTLLGSYYTLKSLMGAIAQFIIIILIALAAIIIVLWIVPFTWGAAISMTTIFIAIAIPMAIILAFMLDVLHVQTSLSIPSVKCFDENTMLKMNDGTEKKISTICIGDILFENNEVTACIKVVTNGSTIYNLDGILVSDSHIMKYDETWIPVSMNPNAIKCIDYKKPYLYCLNTTNKIINVKNFIFTDWDEIYDNDITEIKNNKFVKINNLKDIHTFFDSGFEGSTKIKLKNGIYKNIKDIEIGDILENGENVYGTVKINGQTINKQFSYHLGKHVIIEGGPNLNFNDNNFNLTSTLSLDLNNKRTIKKHDELYHILTNKNTFYIEDIRFYDYNAAIDLFLEKNKRKLLSMKYV